MIDFSRAQLTHYITHFVGNKSLGEVITLAEKPIEFSDDFVKEVVLRYFLTPFKTDIYYHFKGKVDISLSSVANDCEDLFKSREEFVKYSQHLAIQLYNQSMHPKIPGGEFHACFFKDAMCDGELVDCIGLFKSEKRETFIKIHQDSDSTFNIEADNGIDVHKLDKGCLVFNTDKTDGYKLSIVDTNNKVAECALYWEEDFLNARIKHNSYYHTKNFIDTARGFCEEILTEANNVEKDEQAAMQSKSISFFKEKEKFDLKEFENEILKQPEIIEAFKDYRTDYNKRMDLTAVDEFDVSQTAVKKNTKYMRTIRKLDKNFHLYIHSHPEYMERGFDEEKGMKFIKLFYINEE